MTIAVGGPQVQAALQDNSLERVFHDALIPNFLFRKEATFERWEGHKGETKVMSRTGLMAVNTDPLVPGNDPVPSTYDLEQWIATASQHADTLDTDMPTSRAMLASKFMQDTKKLGINAGQVLNRLVRDPLYRNYLAGNTNVFAITAIGAVTLHVASLNGFTEQLVNGIPTGVSAANPIAITFPGAAAVANTVTAAVPDNPLVPFGPGVLTLGAALAGAGLVARDAVLAVNRSVIWRVGGGNSVDAIGAGDILTLQDIIDAVAILENNNVGPCADGVYHHHMSPTAQAQVYADAAWRQLHEGNPDNSDYVKFVISRKAGCDHYKNTVCPNDTNSGALVSTGAGLSTNSGVIGADMVNNAGVRIGRTIIIGQDAVYEERIPEMEYITEAGVTGKVGNFSVTESNGVMVETEGIRYTLRAPLDRLQQVVSQTWSWTGDFPIPSDSTTGGDAVRKRAIVIEHALG